MGLGAMLFTLRLLYVRQAATPDFANGNSDVRPPLSSAAVLRLEEEINGLSAELKQRQTEGRLGEEDMEEIALLVDKLQQLDAYNEGNKAGHYRQRLQNWRRIRDNLMGRELYLESRDKELQALNKVEEASFAEAARLLTEAIQLQEKLNSEFPLSEEVNPSRSDALRAMSEGLLSQPLFRESRALEEKALNLVLQKDWETARKLLEEARDLQKTLNEDFSGSVHASRVRLEQLELKLKDLEVGLAVDRIDEKIEIARQFMRGEEDLKAARIFQQALENQRSLIRLYPDNDYVSKDKLEELEDLRQTALSMPSARKIAEWESEMDLALRERRLVEAGSLLDKLYRETQQLRNQFSRSRAIPEDRFRRIIYLNQMKEELTAIQEFAWNTMVPLSSNLQMSRTEVPQSIYLLLMRSNPSRHLDDEAPVENLTWQEAREFCRRLGWILGFRVRLPLLEEYRQALDREGNQPFPQTHPAPLPVETPPPNGKGIKALPGNVAEWVLPDREIPADRKPDEVAVFFFFLRDVPTKGQSIPVQMVSPDERHRFRGFRFILDSSVTSVSPGWVDN